MAAASPVRFPIMLMIVLLLFGACSETTEPGHSGLPAQLLVVAGGGQTGVVGQELADPLVVRVEDGSGEPVANQVVNFVVTAGGGSVFAGAALTNGDGEARERWTLGTSVADSQRVEVRAVDSETGAKLVFATFEAMPVPDVPATLVIGAGAGQGAAVGELLADSLAVTVKDRYGNPVPDASVHWVVETGGGAVAPELTTSSDSGVARTAWTLGLELGQQRVTGAVEGAGNVTFTASARVGSAATVELDPDTVALKALGSLAEFSALALDEHGNVVANTRRAFTWNVTPSGVLSGARGRYTAASNGTVRVIASIDGVADSTSVRVQQVVAAVVTSVPDANRIDLSHDTIGVADSTRVEAVAQDANGHIVEDAEIAWELESPSVVNIDPSGLLIGAAPGEDSVVLRSGEAADTVTVTVLPGLEGRSVSSTGLYRCALDPSGIALCWGSGTPSRDVAVAAGATPFASLVGGGEICGLTAAGEAYCWDGNRPPTAVPGGHVFSAITVGWRHACGLTAAGEAFCWGNNRFGQLGTGDTASTSVPVPVAGELAFASISAGTQHTCGLTSDGTLYCWGQNEGELAIEPEEYRCFNTFGYDCVLSPEAAETSLKFTLVRSGDAFTCGIAMAGQTYCWGANQFGQLGDGSGGSSGDGTHVPSLVDGGHSFVALAIGSSIGSSHACALTAAGAAYCWGSNGHGQLGIGVVEGTSTTPVAVLGGFTFSSLAAAPQTTCSEATDGRVYCWGAGSYALGVASIHARFSRPTRPVLRGSP